MSFQLIAWMACFLLALEVVIAKLTARYCVQNQWLFNFVTNLFMTVLTLGAAAFCGFSSPSSWGNLLWASFFYALGCGLYVVPLYRLDVTVLSPLYNLKPAIAIGLSAIMLGERLTGMQLALVAVLTGAGMVVTVDERLRLKSFFTWPVGVLILDMAALSLMAVFIKKTTGEIGYWNTAAYMSVLAQIMFLATYPLFRGELRGMTGKQAGAMFLTALMAFGGSLLAIRAYMENVSITATIVSIPLSCAMTLLVGWFAPGVMEAHTRRVYLVRTGATAVMIAAGAML
jgi:drug/metabolite transporter (DMT)-like permease